MEDDIRETVTQNMKSKRKEAGFSSAKSFAEAIGISPSRYTEYEQGRVPLPYEVAWLAADVLKCSMDELGGRKWPPDGDTATPEEAELARIYRDVNADGQRAMMTNARAVAAEYTTPETDYHPVSSQVKGL